MKKFTLTVLSLICFAGCMYAQPTLTGANTNPVPGEKFITGYTDSSFLPVGSAGANVTWDFHTLTFTDGDTTSFVACGSTPFCGAFPGSNLAEVDYEFDGNGIDTDYAYFIANASSLSVAGFKVIGADSGTGTATNFAILQYPLTYNTSYTNSFFETEISTMDQDYYYGTQKVNCDGYGTLITPAGTFQNVLRIHTVSYETDSAFYNGASSANVYYDTMEDYSWYMAGFHSPLLTIDIDESGTDTFYDASYDRLLSNGIAQINNNETTFQLYPNPAKEALTIKFSVPEKQMVTVTIMDMLGRTVVNAGNEMYGQGAHQLTCNTSNLPKGMYLVHVQSNTGSVTRKVEIM